MTVAVATGHVLTLPFLGRRTYLQGTTLLDALLPLVPPGVGLSIRFPRLIETDRVLVTDGGDPTPPGGVRRLAARDADWREPGGRPAHAVLTHSGGAGRLEVRPLEPSPGIRRVPYDEAPLWEAAEFAPGEVRLDTPSPFTFVATCVSLMKALMLRDAPPAEPGQWLFTGMDLPGGHPAGSVPLGVRREAFVAGRMARAALTAQGSPAGRLYFAWITKESA